MKLKSQQTKTTITEVKTKLFVILLGVVAFIGATAPFWHIIFNRNSTEGFIGFTNFRRFLYSFGNHFALFSCAAFLLFIGNFIAKEHKSVVRIVNIVGGLFAAVGIYFLLWVFNTHSDFPKSAYYAMFSVSALVIAYVIYIFNKFLFQIFITNRYTIKNLIAFVFRVRQVHYKKVAVKALYAEIHDKAKVSDETVKDNADAFEKDFYETLDNVN
ncbi:hypothetical protein [Leptobacterium sp. I13]|uniref:hypothetical protein n=1 Tax=Leptobacterium meishanense TaxID=3128904 RepID=UPI0030EE3D1C